MKSINHLIQNAMAEKRKVDQLVNDETISALFIPFFYGIILVLR
jgi:hypothetical protein